MREHRGWLWMGAGGVALGLYGFVATLQPDATSAGPSRRTAACSSPLLRARGMALDDFRPDRYDVAGTLICLVRVGVIMYAQAVSGG